MKRLLLLISSLFILFSSVNAQCNMTVIADVLMGVDCSNNCTGDAIVSYGGGTAPYSVNWSNGSTGDWLSGLCAGTYTVTVTDQNGCWDTSVVVISQHSISANINSFTVTFDYYHPNFVSTNWDLGDGNTSTSLGGLSHTYAQPGTYTVSATTVDIDQGVCTDVLTIDVYPCIDYNLLDSSIVCPTIWDPVCGCDSLTYQNACEAEFMYGVTSWTPGACATHVCGGDIDLTFNGSRHNISFQLIGYPTPIATYFWDFGNGSTSLDANPTEIYAFNGQYTVSLVIVDSQSNTCTYSKNVMVISVPSCVDSTQIDTTVFCTAVWDPVCDCNNVTYGNACEAEFWYGVTSWTLGACGTNGCPGSIGTTVNGSDVSFDLIGFPNGISYYYWTFGDGNDSGAANPTHTYAFAGTYNVSLVIIDSLSNQCTYYATVTAGQGPLCIDASLIDLSAVCPGFNPVCGCDNVTYDNACIAEKCYGVTTWTQGPCSTNQNPNCTTTVSYTYTDVQGPFGHDVYFFGSGTGIAPLTYFWDFGDGSTGTGINATHTYTDTTSIDSLQAFTVCLSILDSAGCVSNYCETIVVLVNPNGNLTGGIYEASNFTGNGGVSTGKTGNGDPMPNVTVHLERADGAILETTVTNAIGIYSFNQLQFGDYRIRIDMPGITHAGEPVSLSPIVQQIIDLDFEVDDNGNVNTDVETIAWLNSFQVSPNPTNGNVYIELGAPESLAAQISIHNLTGQSVYRQQLTLNKGLQTQLLDLSDLSSGIYFISVQSENTVVTRKLIKH